MEAKNTPRTGTGPQSKRNKKPAKKQQGKTSGTVPEAMEGDKSKSMSDPAAENPAPVNGDRHPTNNNPEHSEEDSDTPGASSPKKELEKNDRNSEQQAQKLSDDANTLTALRVELQKEKEKSESLAQQLQATSAENSQISRLGERLSEMEEALEAERAARSSETADREKRLRQVEEEKQQVVEEKQQLDGHYKTLLGRVSTIRSTLGERLKADAEELSQSRRMVEELEEQNRALQDQVDQLRSNMEKSNVEKESVTESLRNRLSVCQQNWIKEREDLLGAVNIAREEHEATRQAMQDWEVIATEERSVRESLGDRVIELEEQLSARTAAHEKLVAEKDRDASAIDGLQRALRDIQEDRRKELREVVETMQSQINQLTQKARTLEHRTKEAETKLTVAQSDLERVLPFEKEVKEKNLLIGKLRHEAVTLNDHLRKALRMLKRDNADDKIDKQLVTNVFLQFVSIERGDTKKYEILQLIASVLDWDDQQREKAGLLRPGTTSSFTNSVKTPPLSPFHRSTSTPSLSDAYDGSRELWSSVLDSEKS